MWNWLHLKPLNKWFSIVVLGLFLLETAFFQKTTRPTDPPGSVQRWAMTDLPTSNFRYDWEITPPETNMSPGKAALSKGKACLPTTYFLGDMVIFRVVYKNIGSQFTHHLLPSPGPFKCPSFPPVTRIFLQVSKCSKAAVAMASQSVSKGILAKICPKPLGLNMFHDGNTAESSENLIIRS